MTRREEQMRDRIRSVEEQLVKAAILLTEARERAEAAETDLATETQMRKDQDRRLEKAEARAEAAEKALTDMKEWAFSWSDRCTDAEKRAEAAEKCVAELETRYGVGVKP